LILFMIITGLPPLAVLAHNEHEKIRLAKWFKAFLSTKASVLVAAVA
jgi:hypothetical protein